MEFPASPVDLADCQLNWEYLKKLLINTGGQGTGGTISLRVGQTNITFTASVNSNTVTVNHNLGRTPIFVGPVNLTPAAAPTFSIDTYVEIGSYTATTFKLFGISHTATTGTVTVPWLAIG